VETAVKEAISLGYRHIDCAAAYGNEAEVGAAIKEKIQDGTVKREDLFIVTKLWNNSHPVDLVEPALQKSLDLLGLDYVDLYLIHWPTAVQPGEAMFPRDANNQLIYTDTDPKETWQGMEKCKASGKAKSIGISNFNAQQITDLLASCKVKPVMNQIEVNPYFVNEDLVKFCQSQDIQVTAYSPLGSTDRPWASAKEPVILEDPKLKAIAERLGKSVPQILLRWLVQRGIIVIPKSVTPSRIKQNSEIFDFTLSEGDMKLIVSFDRGVPLVVPMIDTPDGKRAFRDAAAPNFPFKDLVDKFSSMQQ